LGKAKGVEIRTELIKGVVSKSVVDKIQEMGADLLVMGELDPVLSRTDTFHDEAELIFRKAKCSVLIVKNADYIERLYNALE
jgi:nucleotide-binding universal stress UspA family protein